VRRSRPRLAARLRLAALATVAAACVTVPPRVPPPATAPLTPATLGAALEADTGAPVVAGNRVELLLNGAQIFPAMLAAIRSARHTITFAQYAYGRGPIALELVQALAERCLAGVGVEVLLDGFGSLQVPPEFLQSLRSAGCWVSIFHPLSRLSEINHRSHRRILVVDGRIGFTGGAGVGRKWTGHGRREDHWRDTDVRLEGPVVAELQHAFAEHWREATGVLLAGEAYYPVLETRGPTAAQVIASAPPRGPHAAYTMFLRAIEAAQRSIHISTPYFLPDQAITEALLRAVGRGARVVVLGPGPIDHNLVRDVSRAAFGPLLLAGVEIYEYQPALLHAKALTVDGVVGVVGSANVDNRSFAINAELNLVVYDAAFARRLDEAFADDLRYSDRVDYVRWRARAPGRWLLRLLAAPLRDLF
jgi:cardiolipin synthase A/B